MFALEIFTMHRRFVDDGLELFTPAELPRIEYQGASRSLQDFDTGDCGAYDQCSERELCGLVLKPLLFKNSDEIQDAEMEVSIVELDTYPCWTKSMECRALRDRLEHTRKRLSLHNGPSDFLSDARRAAGALTGNP